MDSSLNSEIDDLDDSSPLPELTFYDLLEPATSKEHQLGAADNADDSEEDDEDEYEGEEFLSTSVNESLNTPRPKKPPIVRILENKRLNAPAPIGIALKNMLGGPIRVLATPTKTTQATDVKILNKLQPKPLKTFGSTPVKIGSTTIATSTAAATSATIPKNLGGVKMTQIKTADGKLLYLQKSGGATAKVPVSLAPTRLVSQATTSSSAIRQATGPKGVSLQGVSLQGAGLIKSAASSTPISVKGLTVVSNKATTQTITSSTATSTAAQLSTLTAPAAAAATVPVTTKMPVQVIRTADGKLIKINQGAPSVLLNAKSTPVAVRAAASGSATVTTTTLNTNNIGNMPAQVIIKGPLKQLPPGASFKPVISSTNSATTTTTTSSSSSSNSLVTVTATAPAAAASTVPTGKMLVQSSTGKQIVVASKNIIKLSPKPGASAVSNPNLNVAPSNLHAIQLPGKSNVQYVCVLPNNNSKTTTSPQKVPLGRPRTSSINNSSNSTLPVGNTSKIVMKTMGGSIVPLPSMQTLVPRRAPGAAASTVQAKAPGNNSSLDAARKHRLSDLNVQIKHLISDDSGETVGPEAKKARYVIAMPNTSTSAAASSSTSTTTSPASQKQIQKLVAPRSPLVQRVPVQGGDVTGSGSSSSGSSNAVRKVYNLVTKSDANGVKYMICNKGGEGKPRTLFNTTMRRGYTLADTKLRRPVTLSPQQLRFKQMKFQQQRQVAAQAQAKLRQQQQQQQQEVQKQQRQSPQAKPQQQKQQLQISQPTSEQANKLGSPAKPLFDMLKPPPVPAAAATLDALGGTRRKHCNCSKSQCLKLYCDCFANGEFCQDCTCKDCFNNLDYEVKRERAIRSCLERNPSAFKPKITAPNSGDMRLHNKGCNCKRSGCLKNYCECYEAKIPCSSMCKCIGCRNMEDRPDVDMDQMDTLMDVKQHGNKIKELNGTFTQDNPSNVYLTDDVIEATIMCMISRIVMHEKQNLPIEDTEREVMEELGESLNQIIIFAKEKNDTVDMDETQTTD